MALTTHKWGNVFGAFADGAILLPLLVALALTTSYDGGMLLATAGLAYIAAGFIFKIPMSVQPLKSVVVVALAVGATMGEIRLSGLAVGLVCLAFAFLPANKWAARVPRSLVHGLQFGLGLLLILKGLSWTLTDPQFTIDPLWAAASVLVLAVLIIFMSEVSKLPLMGWVASAALLVAAVSVFSGSYTGQEMTQAAPTSPVRLDIILALVLPQLALTFTNSVVATHDIAERYYGDAAKKAHPQALLKSIGVGNILTAAVAGLPFCHGSGGLTAHKKGGATTWHMNLIIGGTLLALAAAHSFISPVIPAFHPWVVATLLIATGFFHLKLARPSIQHALWRYQIIIMAVATLWSRNLLVVLLVGIAMQLVIAAWNKQNARGQASG